MNHTGSNLMILKDREIYSLLRFRPFDTSTDDGRARERHRHIAWTTVTAATAKAVTALTMLISVPLTLGYLGPERFGMWMAISAVIAMLGFADFGLSNGLLNAVAHASGRVAIKQRTRTSTTGPVSTAAAAVVTLKTDAQGMWE